MKFQMSQPAEAAHLPIGAHLRKRLASNVFAKKFLGESFCTASRAKTDD